MEKTYIRRIRLLNFLEKIKYKSNHCAIQFDKRAPCSCYELNQFNFRSING